jgi:hypothetical protein
MNGLLLFAPLNRLATAHDYADDDQRWWRAQSRTWRTAAVSWPDLIVDRMLRYARLGQPLEARSWCSSPPLSFPTGRSQQFENLKNVFRNDREVRPGKGAEFEAEFRDTQVGIVA